jgi:hypothetical protein
MSRNKNKTKIPIPIANRKRIVLKVRAGTPKSRIEQLLKGAELSNFAVDWVEPSYLRPRAGSSSDLDSVPFTPLKNKNLLKKSNLISSNSLSNLIDLDQKVNFTVSTEELQVESPPLSPIIIKPLSPEINRKIINMATSTPPRIDNFVKMHPGTFSGGKSQNIHEFISKYEKASRVNSWKTDEEQAQYLAIFLQGAAASWLDNYEALNPTDSKKFSKIKDKIIAAFEHNTPKDRAEYLLYSRCQKPGEDIDDFYNDLVRICRLVDANMDKEDIARHLLRGLDTDIAADIMLMTGNDTPDTIVANYRRVEQSRGLKAKAKNDNSVIEELKQQFSELATEIRQSKQDSTQQRGYINQLQDAPRYSTNYSTPRRGARSPYYQDLYNRDTYRRDQRTENGRPICNICLRPGHIARECRSRNDNRNYRGQNYSRGQSRGALRGRTFTSAFRPNNNNNNAGPSSQNQQKN